MHDRLEELRRRYPVAVTFRFGDSAALCADLLALVRAGTKVATTGALRDFGPADPLPVPGRRDIALDWAGAPALVIETREIVCCRFDEITEPMALAEGESADLDGWRRAHRAYFERNGGFSDDLQVVWERFVLVEDLAP